MDPMAWGSCPSSIPPHHMLEVRPWGSPCVSLMVLSSQGSISFICHLLPQDKAILQVLERPPTATNMALDFLGSPVQRGYVGSPRHKRPDFRGMSPKSFPQHFLQQVQVFRDSCFAPLPSLLQKLSQALRCFYVVWDLL